MVQLCPDFQVKDLHSETTLLSGMANEGIYEWSMLSSLPFALTFSYSKSSPMD